MGQPRKDNRSKRINLDNERVSKFDKREGSKSRSRASGKPRKSTRCERKEDTRSRSQTGMAKDGTNDVSWYANNPELLRAAASLPFSVVNGELLPTNPPQLAHSIPNTMVLHWNPVIAGLDDDAINQAANSMYSYVVHANSRNYKYSAMDLMLLIQAGASFFSMLALGIRTYGLMRLYDQRNKFLPQDWIQMSGFDFDDLKDNLSQMWFDLNQLIAMSQQIWIPNTMPAITRWFWLNTNVYMDANSAKAQYYMFVPWSYLQYSETADQQGGCLLYKSWRGQKSQATNSQFKTWKDYMLVMETMLQQLINSEDRGIIFGDILNAYGSDRIYSVSPISVDYTVTPVYNAEVLTQIENTIVWPWSPNYTNSPLDTTSSSILTTPTAGIFQDQVNLRLYSKLVYVSEAELTNTTSDFIQNAGLTTKPILNFHQQALPAPEQIMVASRLMACGITTGVYESVQSTPVQSGFWLNPTVCGTEYISSVYASQYSIVGGRQRLSFVDMMYSLSLDKIGDVTSNYATKLLEFYTAFDWAPIYYMAKKGLSALTPAQISAAKQSPLDLFTGALPERIYCEYDNWTTVDLAVLKKMHTAAIYSEFGVPVLM